MTILLQSFQIDIKSEKPIKLKDLDFPNKHKEIIPKTRIKNRIYQDLQVITEWDNYEIGEQNYNVVKISLVSSSGKNIFKQPMFLLTNINVKNNFIAEDIYRIYRMRSKIEGVFKFLKTSLGWEDIQVRDWESVKNLLTLCYFIGGYFYHIKSELVNNIYIEKICFLGYGKGKITKIYFLRGMEKLLISEEVKKFREVHNITDEEFEEMLKYAKQFF